MIHRLLVGDGAGLYLPFAQSRLKALEAINPNGFFAQKFKIGNYYIEVRQSPPSQYIRIIGGEQLYFEFETSGRPIQTYSISQGGTTFSSAYECAVVGVTVNQGKARAEILTGQRQLSAVLASKIHRAHQIDLIDEPVYYRHADTPHKYRKMVYDSWAPGHPFTGVFMRCYNFEGGSSVGRTSQRGPWSAHAMRDVMYDIPYADSQNLDPVRYAMVLGVADWPRAAGVQIAKHDTYGKREFAIFVDAFSQFSVFPTSQIGPLLDANHDGIIDQNVDPLYVKMATPTFPSWVFRPTTKLKDFWAVHASSGSIGLVEFPELDWKLHPDGTKACAVVMERQAASYDEAYFTTNVGSNPFTEDGFDEFRDNNTGYAARHSAYYDYANLPQRYCIAPGLLEVTLNIAITGPDPEDFTFSMTTTEIRRPTTTPYCTLLAGYVWYDIKADDWTKENDHMVARAGDMVTLDIERYWRASDGFILSYMVSKNLSANSVIRGWVAEKLLDYDLPTLSFAFSAVYVENFDRVLQPRATAPEGVHPVAYPYTAIHTVVFITTFNKYRRTLYPETMREDIKAQFTREVLNLDPVVAFDHTDYAFMPLNDPRDWSDTELSNLRNYYCEGVFHYKVFTGYTTPSPELLSWWANGMNAFFPPTPLLYITAPKFGWYVYTDCIINSLWVSPDSTFFVHPEGTWAYYDQKFIYNKHGLFGPTGSHDSLTPFLEDTNALEHVIFDAVHLKSGRTTVDTSFMDLYNKAVKKGQADGSLIGTFEVLTKDLLRATLIKEVYDFSGYLVLDLRMQWYGGFNAWYPETGYQAGTYDGFLGVVGSGSLLDHLFDGLWWSAPGYGGDINTPFSLTRMVKFSTCLQLQ